MKTTGKKSRAICYCRVSSEDQVKNLSLSTQEKACREFCAREGYEVIKVFVEEGASAKSADRPKFQEMLAFCRDRKNQVNVLVVYSLSRFSRSTEVHLAVRASLYKLGISLRSVSEKIDESPVGRFLETLLAATAQLDNDQRAERTILGMRAAMERGRWPFQPPLGYVLALDSNQKKTMAHDLVRAPLIREAFKRFALGIHNEREVLKIVTGLGLTNRNGKRVCFQSFHRILENEIYAGWISVPGWGEKRRGAFPPIVTQELFDACKAIRLGKRAAHIPYTMNNPDFPLRRFVRCSACQNPLTGSFSKGRTKRYPYYHCPNAACTNRVLVPKAEMEKIFYDTLAELKPTPRYWTLFKETVLEVWRQRQTDAMASGIALQQRGG